MKSDEDKIHKKIVDVDEILNFIIDNFLFEVN